MSRAKRCACFLENLSRWRDSSAMFPGEGNPRVDLLWILGLIAFLFFLWLFTIGPQEEPGALFLHQRDLDEFYDGFKVGGPQSP